MKNCLAFTCSFGRSFSRAAIFGIITVTKKRLQGREREIPHRFLPLNLRKEAIPSPHPPLAGPYPILFPHEKNAKESMRRRMLDSPGERRNFSLLSLSYEGPRPPKQQLQGRNHLGPITPIALPSSRPERQKGGERERREAP